MRPLFLVVVIGCASPAPAPEPASCNSCHGDESSIAPPAALGGGTSRDLRGVGAHRAHLDGDRLGVQIGCDSCHLVPASNDAEGHVDTPWPAETVWGGLAAMEPVTTWDTDTLTCTSYCHGASLRGGTVPEPSWVGVDSAFGSCQACHGFPPPAPHPQDTDCGACHVTSANGAPDPSTHIDGVLQVEQACDSCHGAGPQGAPPPDLSGATGTDAPGVGQHAVHVGGSAVSDGTACATCHPVPSAGEPGSHLDGVTDVVFSGIAAGGTYTPESQTCTVYCHDGLPGGTASTPAWTEQQGGACNRCHGFPPPAPHPDSFACEGCHSQVVGPGGTIVDPARHLDGQVQAF